MTRVAIIGAGWAGACAALTLARAGIHVSVFEATKVVGGRARKVEKDGRVFDNGQHLLLGAYARSVALMESLHPAMNEAVLRLPLTLRAAPGSESDLHMAAPRIKAPLHLLAAIAGASGLSVLDKLTTIAWAARYLGGRSVPGTMTVASLIAGQTSDVRRLLWEPLCIAALNTPAATASALVFVEVLRRAFTGDPTASDLIVPRLNLSQLLPEPALAEIRARGGTVRMETPVVAVSVNDEFVDVATQDEKLRFDRVILATGPQHVSRLLNSELTTQSVVAALRELQFEPITTYHYEFAFVSPGIDVACPMLMLDGEPGQWLFWQRLPNGHWRASVVISAHHRSASHDEMPTRTLSQLRRSYVLPEPIWHQAITEKRATYACTPAQTRLLASLPKQIGNLLFAGDWCVPELPATLEAAVISGENAAIAIINSDGHD